MRSRDHDIILGGAQLTWDVRNLEWGGNGEGMERGRSV
jgi:hypothetical protein